MTKPFILAIAGGSGSGKTFLAEAIHKTLGEETSSILSQDNYYFDQSAKFDHDGGSVNFDHPEAIDFLLLAEHLNTLKKGKILMYPFMTLLLILEVRVKLFKSQKKL